MHNRPAIHAFIMETIIKENTTDKDASPDDFLHYVCDCNPDVALCGTNVAGQPFKDANEHETDCVMCEEMRHLPCPNCGIHHPYD